MLTVAVERSPLNRFCIVTPIEEDLPTIVANGEFTPLVGRWETDY